MLLRNKLMINYWLMKSEPQAYSIKDLAADKQTIWDGVRNYQTRNFLRQMKPEDIAFFVVVPALPFRFLRKGSGDSFFASHGL